MHPDRLEPGAPVIEHDFARDAVGGKLLGGAKYRREISRVALPPERYVQFLKCPGMALALCHQGDHRCRNAGFPSHAPTLIGRRDKTQVACETA
jgi:hypothetical protein